MGRQLEPAHSAGKERIRSMVSERKNQEPLYIGREGNGRGDWTRTSDLVVPNDARYQTAPHPDALNCIRAWRLRQGEGR